jgi:hypothetical protein
MDTNPNAHRTSGLLPPLSVVIQWPTPNYEDPVTRSKTVPITFCVLGTIMVAVVGVRIWARAVIQRNAGSDDWIMVAAMVRNPLLLGYVKELTLDRYQPSASQ